MPPPLPPLCPVCRLGTGKKTEYGLRCPECGVEWVEHDGRIVTSFVHGTLSEMGSIFKAIRDHQPMDEHEPTLGERIGHTMARAATSWRPELFHRVAPGLAFSGPEVQEFLNMCRHHSQIITELREIVQEMLPRQEREN